MDLETIYPMVKLKEVKRLDEAESGHLPVKVLIQVIQRGAKVKMICTSKDKHQKVLA